jgi:hypothetical protein
MSEVILTLWIRASELTTMLITRLDNDLMIRLDRRITLLTRLLLKNAENFFRCNWEIADAHTGGVVHGVGDGRGYGHERRLA